MSCDDRHGERFNIGSSSRWEMVGVEVLDDHTHHTRPRWKSGGACGLWRLVREQGTDGPVGR